MRVTFHLFATVNKKLSITLLRTYEPTIFDLPVTLTFYSVAAGLSLSLCLVLLIFAWFQPGTLVIRSWAIAVLVLSSGFFVSGVGPLLPRWATVIGTNVALLAAGPILYAGFTAHCRERRIEHDWWGWGILLITIPAFWYWGLIEPDGRYRSMLFSLATATINIRTALLLGRVAWQRGAAVAIRAMALLFVSLTMWMTGRFAVLFFSAPPPADVRGANPTGWMTVFGYIVLMSLMTVCVMWMEVNRIKENRNSEGHYSGRVAAFVEYFRNKLLLLWSAVTVLIVGVVSMLGIGYVNLRDVEKVRLLRIAELSNEAFVEYTIQVTTQVETILQAVRGFYRSSGSVGKTESFIGSLGFDRSIIDNIYLIKADGRIVIAHDPQAVGRSVADREYFTYHRSTASDRIFISSVESGRVTGKQHFRISKRIDNPDGSFGGIVLATVTPEAFARFYRTLLVGSQGSAALLGATDHRLRARMPEPAADRWAKPVDSPLWAALATMATGRYESTSQVDSVRRIFVYKAVGTLPLVMVTGFANADLSHGVRERMRWLIVTSLAILSFTILLALLLTIEAKRRDEQERFMSMLSHELKTPLSILRMALGAETMKADVRVHAQRAVEDMNAVIERCLQADRLKNGRFICSHVPLHLDVMLAELHESCMNPERLTMQIGTLPLCQCDPQIVRIILNNLLDNALKYGSADKQIVVAATSGERHGKPGVTVSVTNGVGSAGIPEAGRVFEKYYRAAEAHSKTGSGLGLYLSFNLARLVDCQLDYVPSDSEVTFELWVPS